MANVAVEIPDADYEFLTEVFGRDGSTVEDRVTSYLAMHAILNRGEDPYVVKKETS